MKMPTLDANLSVSQFLMTLIFSSYTLTSLADPTRPKKITCTMQNTHYSLGSHTTFLSLKAFNS